MDRGLDITERDGWVVLAVTGDLDLTTAPAFRRAVLDRVHGGARRLVVDLTPTDFVDSIGLGMLVAALKRVRSHGGRLVVVCPEPRVRKPLDLTQLGLVLPVVDTVDDAVSVPDRPAGSGG